MKHFNKAALYAVSIVFTLSFFPSAFAGSQTSYLHITLVNNIKPNINYSTQLQIGFPISNGESFESAWYGAPATSQIIQTNDPSKTLMNSYYMCTDGSNGVCSYFPSSAFHVTDASCEVHAPFKNGNTFTVNGYSTCSRSGNTFDCQIYVTSCTIS